MGRMWRLLELDLMVSSLVPTGLFRRNRPGTAEEVSPSNAHAVNTAASNYMRGRI
jgi:hypothetical protein